MFNRFNLNRFACLALVVAGILSTSAVQAQSIEEARRLFQDGEYKDSALAYFDILSNEANPDVRDQAEVYLAESLRKSKMLFPALFYYSDVYKIGSDNRYYLNAVERLLDIQSELHDPILVVSVLNETLDGGALGELEPGSIAQLNYLIGKLAYRNGRDQEASAFLEYVDEKSPFHPRARYLLGLLATRAGDDAKAREHFEAIGRLIPEDTDNSEALRMRNLALVASARAAYGAGKYKAATEIYKSVPRFSDQWFTAMYENSWAHFQSEEYGKALGEIRSVTSPYFSKRHVPEAFVVAATSYFVNCQWDRVRREVNGYKSLYEGMKNQLNDYLQEERELGGYYDDVLKGGAGKFALELARDVRRQRRFKDYHFMLEHLKWEAKTIKESPEWRDSRLGAAMMEIVEAQQAQLTPAVGAWVKTQLTNRHASLNNFQNQVNILDFEVADAERKWLEQGKEILKGRRARVPRPQIPSDQWQHYDFDREYWKDELGYIQHSLASECLDE